MIFRSKKSQEKVLYIYPILGKCYKLSLDASKIKSQTVSTDLTLGSDRFRCLLRACLPRLELELELDLLLLLFFKVLLLATGDKCKISFSIGDQYDTESAAIIG